MVFAGDRFLSCMGLETQLCQPDSKTGFGFSRADEKVDFLGWYLDTFLACVEYSSRIRLALSIEGFYFFSAAGLQLCAWGYGAHLQRCQPPLPLSCSTPS